MRDLRRKLVYNTNFRFDSMRAKSNNYTFKINTGNIIFGSFLVFFHKNWGNKNLAKKPGSYSAPITLPKGMQKIRKSNEPFLRESGN